MTRRVIFVAMLIVVIVGGGAVAALFALRDGDDGWETYINEIYGYSIKYPADWELDIGERLVDTEGDFETQRIGLTDGVDSVSVVVNFQGDWCVGFSRNERREVIVDGVPGRHTECFLACIGPAGEYCPPITNPIHEKEPYDIVRFFPSHSPEDTDAEFNYWISGTTGADIASVRQIIESFSFVNYRS